MKNLLRVFLLVFLIVFGFTGCGVVGNEDLSLSVVYGLCSVVSIIMLAVYCCIPQKRNKWFVLMFLSVVVVNIGYFSMSCSSTLSQALFANRISYLGSVFLPFAMLMIIMDVTKIKYNKRLPVCLFILGVIVLLIAASPGYSTIYYKEVSFEIVNGISVLHKVYGPLHNIYLFYLVGYFCCMIASIVKSFVKKTADSIIYSISVAAAVLVNLSVWFIEQFMNNRFEFLSVSYIISELFLIGLIFIMREHQKLKELVRVKKIADGIQPQSNAVIPGNEVDLSQVDINRLELFYSGYQMLTKTEKVVFNGYVHRFTTKEIMDTLNITENTLKFHNKNLYGKLGVSSRKELMLLYDQVIAVKGQFTE